LGYRQIDPLESKAVTGAITYVFSPKYSMTASSTYDFGTSQALSNSLVLTRMGSDVQVSLGLTYNALVNTFGVTFEIVPNLIGNRRVPGIGPGLLQH
jgi:ABC-type enterochelin transport system permease subunit